MARERVVVDTNVLISRLLLARSVSALAVRKAVDEGQLLASEATLDELAEVLSRRSFATYVSVKDRQQFFRLLGRVVEMVPITFRLQVCRDPKDDKFLELAVNGTADVIVTGDKDLLVLNPFRGIAIVAPARYIRR